MNNLLTYKYKWLTNITAVNIEYAEGYYQYNKNKTYL